MKVISMIPPEKRRNCRCHFCGETRSVKYTVSIVDPTLSRGISEVYCCNECLLHYSDYDPKIYGAVVAIHIWLKDGYQPMADLTFAFGGRKTIEWDNINEREKYQRGINAYTIIYDDRTKLPFESHIRERSKAYE